MDKAILKFIDDNVEMLEAYLTATNDSLTENIEKDESEGILRNIAQINYYRGKIDGLSQVGDLIRAFSTVEEKENAQNLN